MTVEEIKQQYSMRDILDRYGIQVNRNGFARCPFHSGDRDPSLKVYQKDYHCFACGANGDIFTFVQKMDNLSFKEAFQSLGGSYEEMDMGAKMKIYHAKKEREMREKQEAAVKKRVKDNLDVIGSLRERIPKLEPFSDEYCKCQREMTKQLAIYDHLHGEFEGGGKTMDPLSQLTKESILEERIFTEIFDQEDEVYKTRLTISLLERAEELGVKTKFGQLLNAYKRAAKELQRKKQKETPCMMDNWTNFEGPYDRMRCGSWVAGESGIYLQNVGTTDVLACYHPIIPVERLKNLETGDEQLKLAFKRNNKWQELIVPKDMVSTASKITALSKRGVSVTSENAKFLVRYLADVENFNEDAIDVQFSTSKLGWIAGDFIPYDTHIVFDADSRFKQVYEAVGEHGNADIWLNYVRKLRRTGRMEILMMLAASFSSVLISMLGGLPYIVDLWGETEGGKTVTLMLAASVWADPDENRFIGDFKTTDVALEARADLLNHLPMILDDTSKVSRKISENFEGIVYDLCSGKGKSRSNKDLGINRENRWRNCILTNGERPLNSYVTQGGAMNRVLEVECGQNVYEDPREAVEVFKKHYGHAGKLFVDIIRDMEIDELRGIQNDFLKLLNADEKMKKQSISLSIILTADKIVTEQIFKDGCYISLEAARECLIDRNELSDNERCYRYILGEIDMNPSKFDPLNQNNELWGVIMKDSKKGDTAVILSNAFDNILEKKKFSRRSFLSWAEKKGLIEMQAGKPTKVKKINGKSCRCIFLKMEDIQEEETEFTEIYDQEELPFS